jgi:hypothetical protein
MAPRLRNSSRACADGRTAVHSRKALAIQVRRMTRPLWAAAPAILAAWRRGAVRAARIYAKLSKLRDDDPCRCRIERRDLYWRAL